MDAKPTYRVSPKKLSLGFETIVSVLVSWKYLMGHNSIYTVGSIFWGDPAMGKGLAIAINPRLNQRYTSQSKVQFIS